MGVIIQGEVQTSLRVFHDFELHLTRGWNVTDMYVQDLEPSEQLVPVVTVVWFKHPQTIVQLDLMINTVNYNQTPKS